MAKSLGNRRVPLEDVIAAIQAYKAEPLGSGDRTLLLLGRSGVGKSALLNHIVGRTVVTENKPAMPLSQRVSEVESHDAKTDDRTLRVIDIRGLYHPSTKRRGSRRSHGSLERQCDILRRDIQEGFNRAGPIVHAVGIVISMKDRLSSVSVQEMLDAIEQFGISKSSIILIITHGNAIFGMSPRVKIEMGQQEQLRQSRFKEFIERKCFPQIVLDLNRDLGERVVIVDKGDCDRYAFVHNLFKVIDICEPIGNMVIESVQSCMNKRRQDEEKWKSEIEDALNTLEKMRSEEFKAEAEHRKICDRFKTLQEVLANQYHWLYCHYQQNNCRTIEAFVRNSRKLKSLDDRMNRKLLEVCRNGAKLKMGDYIKAAKELIEVRENMRTKFLTVADDIDYAFIATATVKMVGSATAVVGGIMGGIGGVLTLGGITAPAGIPLIVLGSLLGVGGALAGTGGTIGDLFVNKKSQNKGEKLIEASNEKHSQLIKRYKELESMFKNMEEIFQQHRQHIIKLISQPDEIVAANFQASSEVVSKILASWSRAYALAIGSEFAAAGVRTGSAFARGVVGGVETSAEIGATVARTAATASGGILIGVSTLLVAADIAMLAKTAFDAHQFTQSDGTKLSRSFRVLGESIMLTTENLRPLADIVLKPEHR